MVALKSDQLLEDRVSAASLPLQCLCSFVRALSLSGYVLSMIGLSECTVCGKDQRSMLFCPRFSHRFPSFTFLYGLPAGNRHLYSYQLATWFLSLQNCQACLFEVSDPDSDPWSDF